MTEAQLIDLHQDLLPHIEARDRFGSVFQTDWEQLEESPIRIVVASTFPGYRFDDFMSKESARYSLSLMQRYQDDCTSRSGWHLVLKAKDLDRALTTPSRGIVIHVEGIGAYPGSIEKLLEGWWQAGCRSVGPVWNVRNGLAAGPEDAEVGLSEQGKRAVAWLDRHAVVLDLAHMSRASFWDTMDTTAGVVVDSHANARALTDHPRNLDDEQLKAVAERDGVVGVVFSARFLREDSNASVADVIRHLEYIAELIGSAHVAIGTDLGGLMVDSMDDLGSVGDLQVLLEALDQSSFSADEVKSICWRNAYRALSKSLSTSSRES